MCGQFINATDGQTRIYKSYKHGSYRDQPYAKKIPCWNKNFAQLLLCQYLYADYVYTLPNLHGGQELARVKFIHTAQWAIRAVKTSPR